MKIRVYKILKHTKVEGPGVRYCVWFQGCSRRCEGCWAKAAQDISGGAEMDTNEILEDIKKRKNTIEGVTFLGGEPFEQPEALKRLAAGTKKLGLTTLCFTGSNYDDIKIKYKNILKYIDILIDGEFQQDKTDYSRPWTGSKNQNYYFLSDRYSPEILKQYKNKIEINVQKNGVIFINGMGDFEKFTKRLKMLTKH